MTTNFGHDGLSFRYRDDGSGLPVVFQHGLGGDLTVPCALFARPDGVRLISFDARYHGDTRPLGDPAKLSFDAFADDAVALLDHLKIDKAVIGGISMGAGLALNFAIRHPERTLGVILSRPAWLDDPFPENVRVFPIIAQFIREFGAIVGLERFKKTDEYAKTLRESADSATALVGMFQHPRSEETVEKLERIPRDCPSTNREAWKAIEAPTLVMANKIDPIHPFFMGQVLASTIPNADFRELTPKSVNLGKHADDVTRWMTEFLQDRLKLAKV